MKTLRQGPNRELRESPEQRESLTEVLVQSEHVENLVKESAEELSSVNAGMKQALVNQVPVPGVENALEKSEAVESKVQDASDKLAVVNKSLKEKVKERHILEDKLSAVTKQGKIDRDAALHDHLTGLPNRALFCDRLEHGVQQAKRHDRTLAVMFVDLDSFKIINDTYGHDAGDRMLQTIAGRLKENTRDEDTVSRYGGDEFTILINEVWEEGNISMVAESLLKKIQAPCNVITGDLTFSRSIMASIGISIFPKDGTTANVLVTSADRAMYVAKRNKSGYSFAGESQ